MKAVIQRVLSAELKIQEKVKATMQKGLVVFMGIELEDQEEDLVWMAKKIVQMRLFPDEQGKMQYSLLETNGDLLLVSQFTLFASTKKGNRPSFLAAAPPDIAIPLYQRAIKIMEDELRKPIFTGEFGAEMKIQLINDGPVTIILDSKNKI